MGIEGKPFAELSAKHPSRDRDGGAHHGIDCGTARPAAGGTFGEAVQRGCFLPRAGGSVIA
jgi:hypothetical protein